MITETNRKVNEALKLEKAIRGILVALLPLQDELSRMLDEMNQQELVWFARADKSELEARW